MINNISALVQQVQVDIQSTLGDDLKSLKGYIHRDLNLLEKLQNKKISLLEDRFHTKSQTKQLRHDIRIKRIESRINRITSKIKNSLSKLQSTPKSSSDIKSRLNNILSQIDHVESEILSGANTGDCKVAPSSNSDCVASAKATIQAKHMVKSMQTEAENTKTNQTQTWHEKSINLVQKQINAIKKSKFFKAFFKIISPLIDMGIKAISNLCAPGVASIFVSNLCSTLVEMAENAVINGLNSKAQNAQKAQKEVEKIIQSNTKTMDKLETSAKKTEIAYNKAQQSLESIMQGM